MTGRGELNAERLAELQELLGRETSEIAAMLADELSAAVAEIESGLAGGDLPAVALASHAARNSALMLGAEPVLSALAQIEAGARDSDRARAGAGLERLRSAWPELRQALARESSRER